MSSIGWEGAFLVYQTPKVIFIVIFLIYICYHFLFIGLRCLCGKRNFWAFTQDGEKWLRPLREVNGK